LKILLTGAFGNVGLSTLKELLKRNHDIRVFDIKNKRNKRLATKYKKGIEIVWGDLRNYKDVERAVYDRDIVVHVAAIIPPLADKKPKFAGPSMLVEQLILLRQWRTSSKNQN